MTKVVYDIEWNEDDRKPSWQQFRDGLEESSSIFTIDELDRAVDEEYSLMSEEEKYCRMRDGSPTYLEWVLSSASIKIQPGQKIEVDEDNHMYRIIEE